MIDKLVKDTLAICLFAMMDLSKYYGIS